MARNTVNNVMCFIFNYILCKSIISWTFVTMNLLVIIASSCFLFIYFFHHSVFFPIIPTNKKIFQFLQSIATQSWWKKCLFGPTLTHEIVNRHWTTFCVLFCFISIQYYEYVHILKPVFSWNIARYCVLVNKMRIVME